MSGLYSLRDEIRQLLLRDGLWAGGEVLIKRRTDIWNDVAVAAAASAAGQCVVVGTAKGTPQKSQSKESKRILMEVTIPVTLIELPRTGPEEDPTEDQRWEATVLRLQGSPLGRPDMIYNLLFDGFEEVEDKEYVIRQTTFKTDLLLQNPPTN